MLDAFAQAGTRAGSLYALAECSGHFDPDVNALPNQQRRRHVRSSYMLLYQLESICA